MTKPPYLAPLIAIADRGVPFTATHGQAFVRLPGASLHGCYILPVRSPAYRHWFFYQFFTEYGTIPTANAFHAVLNYLEALANEDGSNQRLWVFSRVGADGSAYDPSRILLDLANRECQFVRISSEGWKISSGEGVLLQTSRSTTSLPSPVPPAPGEPPLDVLRSCLNLASRFDWLRCLAWLLAAFRPYGPFPILVLRGPSGSGKSLGARILRAILDPSTSPLTPMPSTVRDLHTAAGNNWILALDHLSSLSPAVTDALCRLSSGLGASLRETARTNPDPLQQYYKRPVILAVTGRWSCTPEIGDRSLFVTLPSLPPASRRTEASLLRTFEEAWPGILAVLCNAVSTALSRNPAAEENSSPGGHCADALAWAIAASPALGCTPDEMRAAFAPAPPPHPIVEAVVNLLRERRQWSGTASQLLALLEPALSCHTPQGVSRQLKTCMLTLAESGIELRFRRLHEGARLIELRQDPGDDPPRKTAFQASPGPEYTIASSRK